MGLVRSSGEKHATGQKQDADVARPEVVGKKSWKVGHHCRAVYEKDGLEYEGTVVQIDQHSTGRQFAVIEFVYYGNIQSTWVDELLPSHGEEARQKQSGSHPEVNSTSSWKVGDNCRVAYSGDGHEYEGIVEQIERHSTGRYFAGVRIVGFGDLLTIWRDELMPSKGLEALNQQLGCFGAREGQTLKTGASGNFMLFITFIVAGIRLLSSYATSRTLHNISACHLRLFKHRDRKRENV